MPLNDPRKHGEDDGLLRELAAAVKAEPAPGVRYEAARLRLLEKVNEIPKENPLMSALKNIARPGRRWVTATGLILVLAAGALFLNPFGRNPSQAYAAVAAQLRKAVTISFAMQWAFEPGQPPADVKIAYREPALERMEMEWKGAHTIQVMDTKNNKGVMLLPDAKSGLEMDQAAMPSAEHERLALINMLTQTVKTLPEQAEAVVGERVIDGRKATGFRSGDLTLWIDVATRTLVQAEKPMGGGQQFVMSKFQIDPPGLGAEMFATTLPAGYTAMSPQAIKLDNANPGEADLVQYLRLASSMIKGHEFPATTNPLEILTLQKAGKLEPAQEKRNAQAEAKFEQEFAQAAQKTVMFTIGLKQENDWHYAGKGVVLGDAKTPIAWWKPTGLNNYRVIWGDLRITEEPASTFPQAAKK